MRTRVLTALAGIPILIGIIVLDNVWLFSSFIEVLTLVALHEYFRMAFPDHGWVRLTGIAAGMLLSLTLVVPGLSGLFPVIVAGLFAVFIFTGGTVEERYRHLALALTGALYLGYLFPHFVLLYRQRVPVGAVAADRRLLDRQRRLLCRCGSGPKKVVPFRQPGEDR